MAAPVELLAGAPRPLRRSASKSSKAASISSRTISLVSLDCTVGEMVTRLVGGPEPARYPKMKPRPTPTSTRIDGMTLFTKD